MKMLADSGAAQVQPPQALLAEVSSQQLPAIQVGGRVLLVEDNEVNRLLVLDGYMAAAAMRELGYAGPILALTANVMAEDRRRCLAAGCDDFLGKPVRAARLLSVCSRLISRGRASSPATMPGVADRG